MASLFFKFKLKTLNFGVGAVSAFNSADTNSWAKKEKTISFMVSQSDSA
jgi:hypothetical protein